MSAPVWLSAEERKKFAEWCEQEVHATRGIVEQMRKMNAPSRLADMYEANARHFEAVAKILRSVQEQTL